jgi:hypothetical protein
MLSKEAFAVAAMKDIIPVDSSSILQSFIYLVLSSPLPLGKQNLSIFIASTTVHTDLLIDIIVKQIDFTDTRGIYD